MAAKPIDFKKCCRICLNDNSPLLISLFVYQPTGNYAEMLTAISTVQVYLNDGYPDVICNKCAKALEKAYALKNIAESSNRRLQRILKKRNAAVPTKKIAFDSFTEIKTEIDTLSIKKEPKLEVEIEVLPHTGNTTTNNQPEKDIVIANTVIRKVEPGSDDKKNVFSISEKPDVSMRSVKNHESDEDNAEYLDDDILNGADSDDDYVPLTKLRAKNKNNKPNKFKKPKLPTTVRVFKDKKTAKLKKGKTKCFIPLKVLKPQEVKPNLSSNTSSNKKEGATTLITCYPLLSNGEKGSPVLLKRPKDATILKVHPNYKPRKYEKRSFKIKENAGSSSSDKTRDLKKIRQAEVKPREKHVCPVCGILTFGLGNHMAIHSEKKKFTCPHCPKTFAQKSNLQLHVKTHTGVKDHICEICGAGFYTQKSLARHNLIHKGERPFGCNLCNKRFIARCDLNRHLRIHSGYKPFKCSICTMSFNAKHQLQNHERMHTGERPYTCQVCNVAFSYKVNLNNHVFKVHGINLKFKSIHTITEDVLRKEQEMIHETRSAILHIMPQMNNETVPQAAAHETIQSSHLGEDIKVLSYN